MQSTTDPPTVTINCDEDSVDGLGMFPHPHLCNFYFVCIGDEPKLRECPDGLLFDPNEVTCNMPDRFDCFVLKP